MILLIRWLVRRYRARKQGAQAHPNRWHPDH